MTTCFFSSLIRDCFKEYYGFITKYRSCYEQNEGDPKLIRGLAFFRRCLFTVSLLLRHFDFEKEEVYKGLQVRVAVNCSEEVYYYLLRLPNVIPSSSFPHFSLALTPCSRCSRLCSSSCGTSPGTSSLTPSTHWETSASDTTNSCWKLSSNNSTLTSSRKASTQRNTRLRYVRKKKLQS